jgi:peptidoglycan hydrolase-like protein with peptidoglycan-binding domain
MRTLHYGVAIALLAGLGACSNMMGSRTASTPTYAPRPVAAEQPTVAPGMVKVVQSKLQNDGYYKQGSVDGIYGSGTEAAVRSFQKDHNLTTNGELDVPTLQALNVANAPTASAPTATDNPAPAQASPPVTQPMGNNANPPPADTTTSSPAH